MKSHLNFTLVLYHTFSLKSILLMLKNSFSQIDSIPSVARRRLRWALVIYKRSFCWLLRLETSAIIIGKCSIENLNRRNAGLARARRFVIRRERKPRWRRGWRSMTMGRRGCQFIVVNFAMNGTYQVWALFLEEKGLERQKNLG